MHHSVHHSPRRSMPSQEPVTSALVAVDPVSKKGEAFKRFCAIIRLFQQKHLLSQSSLVSIIHASLYTVPISWYEDMKNDFAREAHDSIRNDCQGRFEFTDARVLQSQTNSNEDLINQVVRYGQRKSKGLLVVSSNERSGLAHWILGSFSETAALTAKAPVLIIKPYLTEKDFSAKVRLVVAMDATAPLPTEELQWISSMAKKASAEVDLIYVEPQKHFFADKLQKLAGSKKTKKEWAEKEKQNEKGKQELINNLRKVRKFLQAQKIPVHIEVLDEKETIAHTIDDFATQKKAWAIITMGAEKTRGRKLLLGSTTRRLLKLTKRPFLSLRLE